MIRWILIVLIAVLLTAVAPAFGWMAFSLSQPIDTLADNSIVDIIYDGTYVWLATGNGVSGTNDEGATWRSFNRTNGFKRSSVSALAADGARLWVATSYDTSSAGSNDRVPSGGGVQFTDNFGADWRLVEPKSLSSPGMLAYDLAVYDSAVWAPCFYGGLLRSLDRGEHWENVFVDTTLKNDFEEKNYNLLAGRYFSALIDPFHDDSVIVWAGTAEGIQRLYYIGKHKKLASNRINDIAFDGKNWWYATGRGLTKFNDSAFTFNTHDMDNGLPGDFISAVGARGDLVCAGVFDTVNQRSLGFVVSTNGGLGWHQETPEQAVGEHRRIEEIVVDSSGIWAACNAGGLIRSEDGGVSWSNYGLDSLALFSADLRNVFHCVAIAPRESSTTVYAGTDSGIVAFYFRDLATIDSVVYLPLFDDTAQGQQVVSISTMVTSNGDEIWAATRLFKEGVDFRPATLRSTDRGQSWTPHLIGPPAVVPNEVRIVRQFQDTLVWVATEEGMRESGDFGAHWNTPSVVDLFDQSRTISRQEPMLAVESSNLETHIGSRSQGAGFISLYSDTTASALLWMVLNANLVADSVDFVGRSYTPSGSVPSDSELAGNFIPAMALQYHGDSTIIWAAVRKTEDGQHDGICITSNRGRTWKLLADGVFAWNFEFKGDTVFVPTSQGLLMATDYGAHWDTLHIESTDSIGRRIIEDQVNVYAAKYVDGVLWVGTDDGAAMTRDFHDWKIFRHFQSIAENEPEDEQTYVSPSPYSPYLADRDLKFHYRLKHGGQVTIKIYDFANNLVKTVTDGASRPAGVLLHDYDLWDGRNGKGDTVAGGVYLYIIESSGGDKLWGKFMVIP